MILFEDALRKVLSKEYYSRFYSMDRIEKGVKNLLAKLGEKYWNAILDEDKLRYSRKETVESYTSNIMSAIKIF